MKLNKQQQLAVDTIEGAVMVLAGPGTGKTQILSNRIGKILEHTDTQAYNILCLTFTDAGVVAMKNRLVSLYGHQAHQINVYTFHSFCNKVINENPDLIGIKDMEPASEIDKIQIIRQIIDELPPKHALRRVGYDPYFDEGALKDLFNTMKMESLSVKDIGKKVVDYLKDLPNREEYVYKRKYKQFNKGDVKQAKLDDETNKMERLIDAALLLESYNNKLKKARLFDYADMLIYVRNAWDRFEFLLRRYQEQYLYILVDEFQDTNGVQFELIDRLLSYWGEDANIFSVGDDDQCQPGDTRVLLRDFSVKNIKDLVIGDELITYHKTKCHFVGFGQTSSVVPTKVLEINKSRRVDDLFTVELDNGMVTKYTHNHRCYAQLNIERAKGYYVVYMMERKGNFRLGMCSARHTSERNSFMPVARARAERAERLWIVDVLESRVDAYFKEQELSYKYGVPQMRFVDRTGAKGGHSQQHLDFFWLKFDKYQLEKNAQTILHLYNKSIQYPFWINKLNDQGGIGSSNKLSSTSLFVTRACNLIPEFMGMCIFDDNNTDAKNRVRRKIVQIKQIKVDMTLDTYYSLDVEANHNYVADGILTGNCLFEFQGSRLSNIRDFEDKYPDMTKIQLVENYRSNSDILDLASKLIANNTERIISNKSFNANHKKGEGVRLVEYKTKEEEYAAALVACQEAVTENQELAIIYSKHRQVEPLIYALEGMSIPYTTKKRVDALYDPIVKCIITMLTYFEDTANYDPLLYEILNYPFIAIGKGEANEIFRSKRVHNGLNPEDPKRILDFIGEHKISKFFYDLIESHTISSPYLFLKQVISKSYMLLYFKEDDYALSVIKTFTDFVEELSAKNPGVTIKEILKMIKAMKENKVQLPVSEFINRGGVQLMTAHGAKGLEFDNVIMLDCTAKWEPSKGYHHKFKFPDTITLSGIEGSVESSRRAFYVAMTRAKENLTISYSKTDNGKEVNRALYVDELELEPTTDSSLEHDDITEFVRSFLDGGAESVTSTINDAYIDEVLDDFTLSFSAMDQYQKCPIAFYYKYILRVPAIEREHLEFGSAVHYGMEQFYRDMRRNKKEFGPLSDIMKYFKEYMAKAAYKFSTVNYERYIERGETAISSYIKFIQPIKESRVEQYISNCQADGVPLKGMLDLMEFITEVDLNIVDYKTGKFDKKKYLPATEDSIGGQHWRQAFFYFILVHAQDRESWNPKHVKFSYVEPTAKGHTEMIIEKDKIGMSLVREQIQDVYNKIKKHEFSIGCGEDTCQWCNLQTQIKL